LARLEHVTARSTDAVELATVPRELLRMPSPEDQPKNLTLVERALRLITDVRAGESAMALLLTLDVFLVLGSYYLIKPVREALIGAVHNGPRYKSYMGAGVALALFFAVPVYARLAAVWPRNKLILRVSGFFAANLVGFYFFGLTPWAKGELGATVFGLGFLLWMGVFNMMIVAQFWSFAADVYTEEQGKRIFPLVAVGASLGAMAGSYTVTVIIHAVGTLSLMLISAAILVASALLTQVIHARAMKDKGERGTITAGKEAKEKEAKEKDGDDPAKSDDKRGAYSLVLKNKYLLLIAAFTLIFTLVNTSGEYMISQLVSDAAKAHEQTKEAVREFIGAYMGDYFLWVNVVGLVIQLFLVSRIVKYGGFRVAFLIFPVVALASATMITARPTLEVVRIGKTVENSIDYSLNNTVRNMLWLPTTRRMKYAAKQAVDSFVARLGDVLSGAAVFVLVGQLDLGVRGVAAMNIVLIVAWIYVAWRTVDERDRLAKENPEHPGEAEKPGRADHDVSPTVNGVKQEA
jgi:AAA family ATP:ADP antiporter